MTNELDSGAYDDSCKDMSNVIRFNGKDAITKNLIFKA